VLAAKPACIDSKLKIPSVNDGAVVIGGQIETYRIVDNTSMYYVSA
jgi:hypothetical protein